MKILQINKFFFLKGGTERYFFDLAELLSLKKHQVVVWSTKHQNNFPYSKKDLFISYSNLAKRQSLIKDAKKGIKIFWNREANKRLEKIIQREKPDVAHLHNIFSHFSPSIINTLKKHNIPVVMTLHDSKMFCPNHKLYSKNEICFKCIEKNNFKSCLTRKCIDNSRVKSLVGYLEGKWQKDFLKTSDKIDIFITPSLFIKKLAVKSGIPQNKIIHLPHFIDKNLLKSKKIKQEKTILYFGRLSSSKGVGPLISNFLKISDQFPEYKLKIVGKGPEASLFKKMAKSNNRIEFLPKKNWPELKRMISKSYLVVVPSLGPENFPYGVIESMSLGKVVLAAHVGGIPEMIKDKKTGLLFKSDLKNKMEWALNNPKRIKEIGKSAKNSILDMCDLEKHYSQLIKIYERIQSN